MKSLSIAVLNTHHLRIKQFKRCIFFTLNTLDFIYPNSFQKIAKITGFSGNPFLTKISVIENTDRQNTKPYISILGDIYFSDDYTNIGPRILQAIERKLHLQPYHPLSILRQVIESQFDTSHYEIFNDFSPVVSIEKNFDLLDFPTNHPGRDRTDTYYINRNHVLRTHTSAHQIDAFKKMKKEGFLISADVYRKDEIDKNHYPIFHQMEGVRLWTKSDQRSMKEIVKVPNINVSCSEIIIEDTTLPFHTERNPLQKNHREDDIKIIGKHLKKTLERIIIYIHELSCQFRNLSDKSIHFPLKIRWVESYFPFTSPSWELEIFWEGKWLEICGCGIIKHKLLEIAGMSNQIGWAFGLGLERIAMIFFRIPDIRLFWSQDQRFYEQFSPGKITVFQPYSKYPPCYKDIAFWVSEEDNTCTSLIKKNKFHENDFMEIIRNIGGNLIEEVKLIDQFIHPKTKKKSLCYRINYRSMDRSLSNQEVNILQGKIRELIIKEFDIELR
ncbi:unnamed protein product [Pneumocystis jirovecii]|uniref:Phenylalanine--tRNA ligase, mitochondrial n=2 Tax=Pneumocystis jirovecii TaxID=42068 RepID=L0P7R5_PNEJI|nr:phenylalanine-tRNA ligase [Pneumocystis jirovecii RU7]KTW27851.1 phenylalanine-tRNA ligase [Pneumocystis jirovecii RU7]CCJ28398.1 unnamed protein product [Pneumocystis jirovecii]